MTTATLSSAPIATASPGSVGLDAERLAALDGLIERHISENRYPGAQYAVARYGKLVKAATFGDARLDPDPARAEDRTLWLMFSQTKVVVTAALWQLARPVSCGSRTRFRTTYRSSRPTGRGTLPCSRLSPTRGLPQRGGSRGGVGRPRPAEAGCQRLQPGVDSRIEGALPRHGGPLGSRGTDGSGDGQ